MRESDIVKEIREYLESKGLTVFKYPGTTYGVLGFSDLHGHFPDGHAFYLEVKKPGKKPNPHQESFIKRMRETGALAAWCTSVEMAAIALGIQPPSPSPVNN